MYIGIRLSPLLYRRDWHNIVNQLHLNKIKIHYQGKKIPG